MYDKSIKIDQFVYEDLKEFCESNGFKLYYIANEAIKKYLQGVNDGK